MLGLERPAERWIWPDLDKSVSDNLAKQLGIEPLVARILVRRGFTDPAAAEYFLNPSYDHFHDPKLLPDYEPAIKAILGAKERGEVIAVHGDYDVDGVTSAALFTRFLRRIGCHVAPHVPHRIKEGYGIHIDAVAWAQQQGAKLFLTCDCGISAHEQIEAINAAGMIAVVTDHHSIKDTLPDAAAVVNPHRTDSKYPFSELSGVGVVLKLCAGLTEELGHKPEAFYRAYLDLAALGTVADVMPLVDENRVIVSLGLPALAQTRKIGLQALLETCDLQGAPRITARDIGFRMGPRINAAGRIDDSALALELLLTDDRARAHELAQQIEQINLDRRTQQGKAVEEAHEMAVRDEADRFNVIVVASKDWHPGLVGIVAGKLVDIFRRPAFVGSINEHGIAKTSARSIPGFNLGQALNLTQEIHLGGGGHELAAGLSIEVDQIPALRKALHDYANTVLTPEDYAPKVYLDAMAEFEDCTLPTLTSLLKLEPFGSGNPEPVFGLSACLLNRVTATSKPEHVRINLGRNDKTLDAMGFGMAQAVSGLKMGTAVDLAIRLSENWYRGERGMTISIEALRLAEAI